MPAYWLRCFPRAGRCLNAASQRLVEALCLIRADHPSLCLEGKHNLPNRFGVEPLRRLG